MKPLSRSDSRVLRPTMTIKTDPVGKMNGMAHYFDTEIWCGCTDEPKRSADVDFHYYIVRFIRHGMKHLVERESRCFSH
jgi:hypothetical protein